MHNCGSGEIQLVCFIAQHVASPPRRPRSPGSTTYLVLQLSISAVILLWLFSFLHTIDRVIAHLRIPRLSRKQGPPDWETVCKIVHTQAFYPCANLGRSIVSNQVGGRSSQRYAIRTTRWPRQEATCFAILFIGHGSCKGAKGDGEVCRWLVS